MRVQKMEQKELKDIIIKAQVAVEDVKDEELKKIAFQKILDSLLNKSHEDIKTINNEPHQKEGVEEKIDISSLFSKKNPKSHPDIVLTIAYYFHYNKGGGFNIEDLLSSYKKLLIPKPTNPTDNINKNIRKRLIMKLEKEKDSKQSYQITKDGIDYVNNRFKGRLSTGYSKKKIKKEANNEERD